MNDCKTVQPLLSEYVDNALPAETAWDVKLHLASCAVCARVAEDLAATARLLGALPRRETSAGFEAALARRLADQVLLPRRPTLGERVREWWSFPRMRPALATAGALAVLIPVALVATRLVQDPQPQPTASAEQQFAEQFLDEHASYAVAEPLADHTAVILASLQRSVTGEAGRR